MKEINNKTKKERSKLFRSLSFTSCTTITSYGSSTTLRLKNVNTDFSPNFKDAVVGSQKSVVLAHGIHSDLFTWNDFATDIATDKDNARNTWLIEMYGGPTTECSTCPVYTFDDLRYYYWPALIAGVERYSGQNTLDYVGYDLGCTVALESLENYSDGKNNAGYYFDSGTGTYQLTDLAANPIDTFVGVACIGNFSTISTFTDIIRTEYNEIKNDLPNHFNFAQLISQVVDSHFFSWNNDEMSYISYLLHKMFPTDDPGKKISKGVYDDIIEWVDGDSPNIGENVNLNNFAIIQGRYTPLYEEMNFGAFFEGFNPIFNPVDGPVPPKIADTDGFVATSDQKEICQNVDSNNKIYINFNNQRHFRKVYCPFETSWCKRLNSNSLSDKGKVHNAIIEFLNNKDVSSAKYDIISRNYNCS